jgi:hypothetical protein
MEVTRLALAFFLSGLLAAAALASKASAEEPAIDHQPVECSTPDKNTRLCAYVLDDGEVKRVRAYFRGEKQQAFYYIEMAFDGIQFCATLPVAKKNVASLEYYLWAVDDEFQSSRTRSYLVSLSPDAPCAFPVIDEEPERISNIKIYATSEKQGSAIEGFEQRGIIQFHAVKKK